MTLRPPRCCRNGSIYTCRQDARQLCARLLARAIVFPTSGRPARTGSLPSEHREHDDLQLGGPGEVEGGGGELTTVDQSARCGVHRQAMKQPIGSSVWMALGVCVVS